MTSEEVPSSRAVEEDTMVDLAEDKILKTEETRPILANETPSPPQPLVMQPIEVTTKDTDPELLSLVVMPNIRPYKQETYVNHDGRYIRKCGRPPDTERIPFRIPFVTCLTDLEMSRRKLDQAIVLSR